MVDLQSLSSDEVHVWYVFTDCVRDAGLLARYEQVLSADELARHRRFVFPQHRHQFLVSHALVRGVLSRYADISPAAWQFSVNAHGKPVIADPKPVSHLRFNLSHTAGLAAVAVAEQYEIGVDVEHVGRRPVGLDLAERFFAPAEVESLRRLDGQSFQEAFLAYWTLKEAYIKARGLGLALPLDAFTFHIDKDQPRISFSSPITDDPSCWQFAEYRPGSEHKLALAIHRPYVSDLKLHFREIVPLEGNASADK